jgi:hypothetical protein
MIVNSPDPSEFEERDKKQKTAALTSAVHQKRLQPKLDSLSANLPVPKIKVGAKIEHF